MRRLPDEAACKLRPSGPEPGSGLRRRLPRVLVPLTVAVGLLGGCGEEAPAPGPEVATSASSREASPPAGPSPAPGGETSASEFGYAGPVGEARERIQEAAGDVEAVEEGDPVAETEQDWAILRETLAWAREQGLHRLPTGEIMAIVGTTFVGTPYVPHTLELPGPERLVVNLRALDCVTFVESMLAIARLLRTMPDDLLERDDGELRERYRDVLTRIRYRNGELDGYASRLHYFSDWIHDNASAGFVTDVTETLGGERDRRSIHFMTSNVESYRQLGESDEALAVVAATEAELGERRRFRIPQDRISEVEAELQNGDIIATTSTVDGLDIAHTGLVLRHGGRVHLLHAPLVGETVEISERPLAERIQALSGQDGIMVARPLDRAP